MLKSIVKNNIKEFVGSFGDLGTFMPLAISLIVINKVNPTSLFVIAGAAYILTGIYFKIPIPVQPMKMIAVAAIATGVKPEVLSSAAIIMGLLFIIFYAAKIMEVVYRYLNIVIVKGIQFGLGIILVGSGLKMVFKNSIYQFGPVIPSFTMPNINDFMFAFMAFVLPQLPLTIGNSVVATVDASKVYFKNKLVKVTPSALSLSLGLVNIVSGILGGIPLCHGSGGLTAHYYFGARTKKASIIIGTVFIILGIFFGKAIINLISFIPFSVLGIFLIYVGIKHALLLRDLFVQRQKLMLSVLIGSLCVIISLPIAVATAFVFSLILKYSGRLIRAWT